MPRGRKPNWKISEQMMLLSALEDKIQIIENKKIDAATIRKRNKAWKEVHQQYNKKCVQRSVHNLRAQWEVLKKAARVYAADKGTPINMTGVGFPKLESYDDDINALYGKILWLLHPAPEGHQNVVLDMLTSEPLKVGDVFSTAPEEKQHHFKFGSECSTPLETYKLEDLVPSTSNEQDVADDPTMCTPKMLQTPISPTKETQPVIADVHSIGQDHDWSNYQKPAPENSALKKLHEQKIAAVKLQMKLEEEVRCEGRSAHELEIKQKLAAHKLDMKLKAEQLKQEELKTKLLLIKIKKESQ